MTDAFPGPVVITAGLVTGNQHLFSQISNSKACQVFICNSCKTHFWPCVNLLEITALFLHPAGVSATIFLILLRSYIRREVLLLLFFKKTLVKASMIFIFSCCLADSQA